MSAPTDRFDVGRLSGIISPLRRGLLRAARTAEHLPDIPDASALGSRRSTVVAALREKTFGAFPAKPPPLEVQIEYEFDEDAAGYRFGFTSEKGWRLQGQLLHRKPLARRTPFARFVRCVSSLAP